MKRCLAGSLLLLFLNACNLFEVRKAGPPVTSIDTTSTLAQTVAATNIAAPPIDSVSKADSLLPRHKPVADRTRNRDTVLLPPSKNINTGAVHPEALISYAETLIGVPYKYASTNPAVGFDCSGFITYVFNHFKISVPRSSIDFTDVGKTVTPEQAKRGDIILFTGTDSTERFVGHMGLVVSNNGTELEFIHSSSGKAMGVTVTPLNVYYKKRFVRISRIFPQNDQL